jgi:hypothetical protein
MCYFGGGNGWSATNVISNDGISNSRKAQMLSFVQGWGHNWNESNAP